MSKFIVIFENEAKAYEGTRILSQLHADGGVVLFSESVIAKDFVGIASLRVAVGALGSAAGALTVRLTGGPVGATMQRAGGAFAGACGDLLSAGVLASFVQKAADALKPGSTVIFAEIVEDWLVPFETEMRALGGNVLRICRGDSECDDLAQETARQIANIERLKAEYARATRDANTARDTHRDAATLTFDEPGACAKRQAAQADTNATTDALSGQAAAAARDARMNSSIVKANAEARSAKLHQACGQSKDALR